MRLVLVDSSAFLSLQDPDEPSHARTRSAHRTLVESTASLVTTSFVLDESHTLLLSRLGRDRAVVCGESFRRGRLVRLLRVEQDHEERAWETLDRHFRQY